MGPNPLFLQYIAQVLPSLGEAATRQTTVERLVGGRVAARTARRGPPQGGRPHGHAPGHRRPRPPAPADRGPVGGHRGVGCGSRPGPRRGGGGDRGARRALWNRPERARTRVRRLAGSGTPDSRWRDAAVGGLRRRDAHQHRAQHRRGEDLAVAVGPGAGEARPHEPACPVAGGRRAARRRRAAGPAAHLGQPSASTTNHGRSPSWCWWTRPRRCSTVSGTYGHAVVDEAQDLSAMELRAVARCCRAR